MATERKHVFVSTSQDQYDFIAKMSGYHGLSMSKYVGRLIDADKEKNNALYQKLVSFGFIGVDPEAERTENEQRKRSGKK